jgi:hypothetical protein
MEANKCSIRLQFSLYWTFSGVASFRETQTSTHEVGHLGYQRNINPKKIRRPGGGIEGGFELKDFKLFKTLWFRED